MYDIFCLFILRILLLVFRILFFLVMLFLNIYFICIGVLLYNEFWFLLRENFNLDVFFLREILIIEGFCGIFWSFFFRFMVLLLEKNFFFSCLKVECFLFCLVRFSGIFLSVGGVLLFVFVKFFFLVSFFFVG